MSKPTSGLALEAGAVRAELLTTVMDAARPIARGSLPEWYPSDEALLKAILVEALPLGMADERELVLQCAADAVLLNPRHDGESAVAWSNRIAAYLRHQVTPRSECTATEAPSPEAVPPERTPEPVRVVTHIMCGPTCGCGGSVPLGADGRPTGPCLSPEIGRLGCPFGLPVSADLVRAATTGSRNRTVRDLRYDELPEGALTLGPVSDPAPATEPAERALTPTNIGHNVLTRQAYELGLEIERLPASDQQTTCSTAASALLRAIYLQTPASSSAPAPGGGMVTSDGGCYHDAEAAGLCLGQNHRPAPGGATEPEARADEVQRALDKMCSNCRDGHELRDHPRGGVGHLVDPGNGHRRWYTCGRDNWTGDYLMKRLAALRAADRTREDDHA